MPIGQSQGFWPGLGGKRTTRQSSRNAPVYPALDVNSSGPKPAGLDWWGDFTNQVRNAVQNWRNGFGSRRPYSFGGGGVDPSKFRFDTMPVGPDYPVKGRVPPRGNVPIGPPLPLPPRFGLGGGSSRTPYPIPKGEIAPVDRPNAQYYGAGALASAAPNAGANPGWYSPGEVDRFSSVMNADQLRGLMPLIQAEQQRLGAGTTTPAKYADFSDFQRQMYAANPNAPSSFVDQAAYAADPGSRPTTTTPSGLSQWQSLSALFPGLSQQGNGFSNQVIPGFNSRRTPEQLAAQTATMATRNAVAPAGQQWGATNRPGGLPVWGYQPIPGYQPPPVASYRGGIPRR